MNQLDIFGSSGTPSPNQGDTFRTVHIEKGEYIFVPNFFSRTNSDNFYKVLKDTVDWKQESMQMYGKKINFPRLTAWYGDSDKPYSFSGITLNPKSWTNELSQIRNAIEPFSGTKFNSVLLNLYRDGNDSISWHTDAEKELGINPIISSVNFGATRVFQLRNIDTKRSFSIELTHGSLLVMKGELQHFWQHQVPKTKKNVSERINLTFRSII